MYHVESHWIELDQGVPRRTILGPLLFNLYNIDLNKRIPANTNINQYADDSIILTYNADLKLATYNLEQSLRKISEYNQEHRLMLNHTKTEFITYSKKSKLEETKKNILFIGNYKIPNVNCVKYLGIYLDCTLNFQEELKRVLCKMATGIKTLKHISRPFPQQTRLLLLNSLVTNHLHYSSFLPASSKNTCFTNLRNN